MGFAGIACSRGFIDRGSQLPRTPCDTLYRFGGNKFRLRIKIVAPCSLLSGTSCHSPPQHEGDVAQRQGEEGAAPPAPLSAFGRYASTPFAGTPRNAPSGGVSQRRATEDGRPYMNGRGPFIKKMGHRGRRPLRGCACPSAKMCAGVSGSLRTR